MTHIRTRPVAAALAVLSLLTLAACGGSGGSDNDTGSGGDNGGGTNPPPVTTFDPAALQGRWATASGVPPGYTALVVPDSGAKTATAWLLAQDASRLIKAVATEARTANGWRYDLSQGGTGTAIASGTLSADLTASPKSVSFTNLTDVTLTLTQSDSLNAAAVQAELTGSWKASAGAVDISWAVNDTGTVTGSSTTGCIYAGTLVAQGTVTAYRLGITETCAGSVTTLQGVATLATDKARLTAVATANSDAKGTALFFTKQP
jgi:hypothetical protein